MGKELLSALGLPVAGPTSAAAHVDPVDSADLTEGNLAKMAGNGMHLPSVGLVIMVALLCTEPVGA